MRRIRDASAGLYGRMLSLTVFLALVLGSPAAASALDTGLQLSQQRIND